jgi:hypothetical protein
MLWSRRRRLAFLSAAVLTGAVLRIWVPLIGHGTFEDFSDQGVEPATGSGLGFASSLSPANLTATASPQEFDYPHGCTELPVIVSFNRSATGGYPPYNYTWTFGDTSPDGYGPSPSHTYSAVGTYNVTLIVTDAHGQMVQAGTTAHVFLWPGCGPMKVNVWSEVGCVSRSPDGGNGDNCRCGHQNYPNATGATPTPRRCSVEPGRCSTREYFGSRTGCAALGRRIRIAGTARPNS